MGELEIPADVLNVLTDRRITAILADATEPQAVAFIAIMDEFTSQIEQQCDHEKAHRMLNGDPKNEYLRFEVDYSDLKLFNEIVEDLTEPPATSATGDGASDNNVLQQLRHIAQDWAEFATWSED